MCLVDEYVHVVAGIGVFLQSLEFVDHGQDQAALVGFEHLSQGGLGVGTPYGDVLLLHLAEQAFNPALELPFEFRPVHYYYHGRCAELVLAFQDQTSGREQGEGLARALGMPYKSALFRWLGAALDDAVHGSALVLAQHGFLRLAVLRRKTGSSRAASAGSRSARRTTGRRSNSFPLAAPSTAPWTGALGSK